MMSNGGQSLMENLPKREIRKVKEEEVDDKLMLIMQEENTEYHENEN